MHQNLVVQIPYKALAQTQTVYKGQHAPVCQSQPINHEFQNKRGSYVSTHGPALWVI